MVLLMTFRFNKRVKVLPGVRLNFGKKGFNSITIGVRGASFNINKLGTKHTIGVPGSGVSYSTSRQKTNQDESFSILLMLGIILAPYIFSWFLLRKKHGIFYRAIGFSWMIYVLVLTGQSN